MIVTLEHMSTVTGFGPKPGLCRRGARAWFERYGLSWDEFRTVGIDADVLRATGDAFALAVVAHAENMEAARGRVE